VAEAWGRLDGLGGECQQWSCVGVGFDTVDAEKMVQPLNIVGVRA
jgi:hypothetical protein